MANVLIYGSDHLAYRISEQLCAEGCVVSVIARPGSWLASAGLENGQRIASFLCKAGSEAVLLQEARIDQVETLLAVADQDEANLGLTLAALELNPSLRVVLRQFNVRLGRLLEEYLPQCEVLSMSTLAASTFALAATTAGIKFAHILGRDTFVLREESGGQPKKIPASSSKVIAAVEKGAISWFPPPDKVFEQTSNLLIASTEHELQSYPRLTEQPSLTKSPLTWRTQRILLGVVGYLVFVVIFASSYFYVRLGMRPLDAVYFVITTITSVGFGDFSLREADALSKVVGILLMISGVGITAVFFALITNNLVAHQQAFEQGRVRQRVSNHTVVCGLGVVGLRVAEKLQQLGERVVCIEKAEDNRFLIEARRLGIPVVIGNALQEQTLHYANIEQARALVVCSNPDHLNLEIALNARSVRKELPIVVRMFDPDLARRVAHHFELSTTFSSAALVAARFSAQATGSTRFFSFQFHNRSFDLNQIKVSDREGLAEAIKHYEGKLIAAVDAEGRLSFELDNRDDFKPTSVIVIRELI